MTLELEAVVMLYANPDWQMQVMLGALPEFWINKLYQKRLGRIS